MSHVYDKYYNGDYLMDSLDCDGNKPGWYVACSSERGPGKTTYFSRYLLQQFIQKGEQFALLCRDVSDLGRVASGILNSYLDNNKFDDERPKYTVRELIAQKGAYSEIHLMLGEGEEKTDQLCGFVLPIRQSEKKLKRCSSAFVHVQRMFFDEFQPMQNSTYLKDEIELLTILFDSVARGDGEQSRYVPIILASNTISLGNPYFTALGLNTKIQSNTAFYRGKGVVFEQVFVNGLAEKHKSNPFHVALQAHESKRKNNLWINDDGALVMKPSGRGLYLCTIEYMGDMYGLLEYGNLWYISRKIDKHVKYVYATDPEKPTTLPQLKLQPMYKRMRDMYYKGRMRVQDCGCQNMLVDLLA